MTPKEAMRKVMAAALLAALAGGAAMGTGSGKSSGWTKEELRKRLTPLQYKVTQEEGTEPPFKNEYWDNHEAGLYVDVVSGEPLFSSTDKFDSGTGWPSFKRPVEGQAVAEREDRTLWMRRVEVRSRKADSHLGHVFDDGPAPTGKRYCMNSAALRFIPAGRLEAEGYGRYAALFKKEGQGGRSADGEAKGSSAGGSGPAGGGGDQPAKATFAGGCFWCMEPPFEKLPGVRAVVSGYTGGGRPNPTYKEVSAGVTGHLEAVQVSYDPVRVGYAELLEVFWRNVDPTDPGGQFVDRGEQYGTAIFYHDEGQKRSAEESKKRLAASGRFQRPIATAIRPAAAFYPAEDYHQDYYKKNPVRYKFYRYNSGRDQFLERTWGKEPRAAAH